MPAKTLPTQKSLESDLWIEIEEHAQTGKGPLNIWLAKWAHEKIQEAYRMGEEDGFSASGMDLEIEYDNGYDVGYDEGYEAGYDACREESTLDKLTK